jgi:hypothetical protein
MVDGQDGNRFRTAIRKKEHTNQPPYVAVVLREDRVRTEVNARCGKCDDVIIDTGGEQSIQL